MRVILNPLIPNKDGYLTPVKPSQVYHCDNINQFVTQVVKAGSLYAEYVDLCNIVGYCSSGRNKNPPALAVGSVNQKKSPILKH